jgi:hypothetical protein
MDDTRARFLAAIAGRLGADRIVEVHLFSPIRQGVLETGVAVVAATEERAETAEPAETAETAESTESAETAETAESAETTETAEFTPTDGRNRLAVHTARYRFTRKGPERGKWTFDLAAEADAPLATVDAVARGVTQRSKDLTESERLSGEQVRALLGDPIWRTPT